MPLSTADGMAQLAHILRSIVRTMFNHFLPRAAPLRANSPRLFALAFMISTQRQDIINLFCKTRFKQVSFVKEALFLSFPSNLLHCKFNFLYFFVNLFVNKFDVNLPSVSRCCRLVSNVSFYSVSLFFVQESTHTYAYHQQKIQRVGWHGIFLASCGRQLTEILNCHCLGFPLQSRLFLIWFSARTHSSSDRKPPFHFKIRLDSENLEEILKISSNTLACYAHEKRKGRRTCRHDGRSKTCDLLYIYTQYSLLTNFD